MVMTLPPSPIMPTIDLDAPGAQHGRPHRAHARPRSPVKAGDTVARIHPTTRTGLPPTELRAGFTGLLAARHFPGLIQPGDCAAVVAVPI